VTNPVAKRGFDLFFSAAGLLLLSPLLLLIAVAVKFADGGAVFFRQQRVGQFGRLFFLWKFRSMVMDAERAGPSITQSADRRITPIGRILRKTKLDELPQLWNVLHGDMSFVGPRPEVPRYVERYTDEQRQVLNLKPGITDAASLEFRREEELLSSTIDAESFYVEHCIPKKIELSLAYNRTANLWRDTQVVVKTVLPTLSKNARARSG
jgi:lipopolysaccharide/colanic/teichoic acid biosynthesis glycosyltransferase